MSNLGNILHRLIEFRAKATGRLVVIDLEIADLLKKVAALKAEREELSTKIVQCDEQINDLSLIDVSDIRVIGTNTRHQLSPHGLAIKSVVAFFRSRAGESIDTDELATFLLKHHYAAGTSNRVVMDRIRNICLGLSRRGVLERGESRRCGKTNQLRATWRWVGNEAMNALDQTNDKLPNDPELAEVIDLPSMPLTAVINPVH